MMLLVLETRFHRFVFGFGIGFLGVLVLLLIRVGGRIRKLCLREGKISFLFFFFLVGKNKIKN